MSCYEDKPHTSSRSPRKAGNLKPQSNKQEFVLKDAWNDSASSYEETPKHALKPATAFYDNAAFRENVESKDECHNSSTSVISEVIHHKEAQIKDFNTTKTKKILKVMDKKGQSDCSLVNVPEKLGFSESSCLSLIQLCTDDPSIMCHCQQKPTHSVPELDCKHCNLRSYETAPDLTTHGNNGTSAIKTLHTREMKTDSLESSTLAESDSDLCVCHEKETFMVLNCDCEQHKNIQGFNIVSQRMCSCACDPRSEEGTSKTESKPQKTWHCTSKGRKKFQNPISELYAAKVSVGSADVPKQFVFNAVNSPKYQNQRQNEVHATNFEKQKKRSGFFRITRGNVQKPKFSTIGENETWEHGTANQDLDVNGKGDKRYDESSASPKHSYIPERIEIYYFDHGCAGYFRTTDYVPPLSTNVIVEKVDITATKFWAEIFGALHIITTFIIAFVLQLLRFIFYSVIRPILVGVVQITSDYFYKPLLAITFNAILQPIFIFFYNIFSSIKDICEIIALSIGYFLREIAYVFRAIRFIEVKNSTKNGPFITPKDYKTEV